MRKSQFFEMESGANSGFAGKSPSFHNDLPPHHDSNKEALTQLQGLDVLEEMRKIIERKALSPDILALLIYARSVLLFRIAERDDPSAYTPATGEAGTLRQTWLARVESELRGLLERVAAYDEISFL